MSHKIRTDRNRSGDGIVTPIYSINYGVSPKDDVQRSRSAAIIHSLSSGADIIVDVQSEFFSAPFHLHDAIVSKFIEKIERHGYKYCYSKGSKEYEGSFFEKLFRQTKKVIATHRIMTTFSSKDFIDPSRFEMLPFTGVWYHFVKNSVSCDRIIEKINSGSLYERSLFSILYFSIFDYCALGRMGIFGIEIPEQYILGKIGNIHL